MFSITIDFTDAWLDFRFGELLEAINASERTLKDEAAGFDTRMKAMEEKIPEEQRREFHAEVYDEYSWFYERLPNVLRRALFLVCYAEIEAYLRGMCRESQKRYRSTLSLNEVAGKGIKRARLYLIKAASVAFPPNSSEWQALTDYNKIRNVLAHSEGQLSDEQKEGHLGKYVDQHEYLELGVDDEIVIRQGFCEEVVETALQFFKQFPRELRV